MRFPDFEHDWESKKLKDLSNIQRGASPRPITAKKWYDNENKKVGWVRIGDVTSSSKYLTKTEDYFSEEGVKKSRFLPKGSLIMSICATIGKPIVTGMDTCIHDGFVGFSELKNINKEFLYYYLNILEPKFISLSQTGSQANLNSDLVRNAEIGVPSIQEQEKIVNFISAVDKKHNILNKNLETQLSFKRYLMQQIFTQKLRFNFNDTWKTVKIKDIFDERSEKGFLDLELLSVTLNDGVIKRSEIESKDNSNENKSNYKHVLPGDIVYNSMRMWQGASGVSPYEGIVSPAYTILIPKNVYSKYFGYYFKTNEMVYQFKKYSQGLTSDTWNLKYPLISEIKIKIPSIEEQKEITNVFEIIDEKIKILQNNIDELTTFKKGLLQQMFVVRINWRCNFKLAKSPSFNKHLLILKNKIIFIIIK